VVDRPTACGLARIEGVRQAGNDSAQPRAIHFHNGQRHVARVLNREPIGDCVSDSVRAACCYRLDSSMAGAWSTGVVMLSSASTGSSLGSLPLTVAVLTTSPSLTSSWVTV